MLFASSANESLKQKLENIYLEPYFGKPRTNKLDRIFSVDPEDEEVRRIKFFVDQLREGAHLGQLLRGQVVVGTGIQERVGLEVFEHIWFDVIQTVFGLWSEYF